MLKLFVTHEPVNGLNQHLPIVRHLTSSPSHQRPVPISVPLMVSSNVPDLPLPVSVLFSVAMVLNQLMVVITSIVTMVTGMVALTVQPPQNVKFLHVKQLTRVTGTVSQVHVNQSLPHGAVRSDLMMVRTWADGVHQLHSV